MSDELRTSCFSFIIHHSSFIISPDAHLDRPCELAARAFLPRAGGRVQVARARGRGDGEGVRTDGRAGRGGGPATRGRGRARRREVVGEGREPSGARVGSGALGEG